MRHLRVGLAWTREDPFARSPGAAGAHPIEGGTARLDLNRAVRVIAAFAISARDGFLFSIGAIVALVPEGLLPTLTLSLAMSATRMAHRGALVRHLEAVETFGCTTVIPGGLHA